MGIKCIYKRLHIISIVIFILSAGIFAADVTLEDVAQAQEAAEASIETMSATIVSENEYQGQKKTISYDYVAQIDAQGNKKVMVKANGVFNTQFLVDTKAGTMEILMNNGTTKVIKMTDEQRETAMKMAGIGGLGAGSDIRSLYAAVNTGKVSDASGETQDLKVQEFETPKMKYSVKKEFWGGRAIVEYNDKEASDLDRKIDERLVAVKGSKAESEGGKLLKERFIKKIEENRGSAVKYQVSKRIEKINLKSGLVEEQEMYNLKGEKIGFVKTGRKVKLRVKRPAKMQSVKNKTNEKTDTAEIDIEFPVESESEMDSPVGMSKARSTTTDLKINEPVSFSWQDVKQEKEKMKNIMMKENK